MFRNYLTAALRNLARNRLYAAINIAGLAVGFAAALLIAMFVRDELTFDRYFPDYERIYLLGTTQQLLDRPATIGDSSAPEVAKMLRLDFPFINATARIETGFLAFRVGDVESTEQFVWADSNIFEILKLRPVAGDLTVALTRPDSIVLTRALAQKYFGTDDPLGKTLELKTPETSVALGIPKQEGTFTVTAVIEDLPYNTHLRANVIVAGHGSMSRLAQADARPPSIILSPGTSTTYLKIDDPGAAQRLAEELPAFLGRHSRAMPDRKMELTLKPLATLHFAPGTGMGPRGSMEAVVARAAIGLLIVVAASINFVNLMTARASRRAVEVGIRKAAGAARRHLVTQFVGESVIYVVIGVALGLVLAALLLPSVNGFLGRKMHLAVFSDPMSAAFVVAMALLVGVLAGLYPAFVLSSFRPAVVLKAGVSQGYASALVRQSLVVLQFALLIGLLIAAAVVQRQIDFALTEAQRLDIDEVVNVNAGCRQAFRDAVAVLPGVRAATCSTGAGINGGFAQSWTIRTPGRDPMTLQADVVDPGFFEFYGLSPLAGRFFDGRASDEKSAGSAARTLVINEAAMRKLGYASPEAAIGGMVDSRRPGQQSGDASEIVGVVPDFAGDTIRTQVEARVFYVDPQGYVLPGPLGREPLEIGSLSVRLDGPRTPETLQEIDKLWKAYGQPRPISRSFLSQNLENRYRSIARQRTMFAISAGVAIFIALLGLFGMAAFTAESRTKEIGIRKAMGATQSDILGLLLWRFARPVLWANLIAWPVAGYFMRRWLQTFVQNVGLELWVFLAVSAAAVAVAMLTVLGHATLVARAKPATALRYE